MSGAVDDPVAPEPVDPPNQPTIPKRLVSSSNKKNYHAQSLGVCCMCGWPFSWNGGDPTRLGHTLYKCEHVYMGGAGQGFYRRLFWSMEKSHILHTHLTKIFHKMHIHHHSRQVEMSQFILRVIKFDHLKGETVFVSDLRENEEARKRLLLNYTFIMRTQIQDMIMSHADEMTNRFYRQFDYTQWTEAEQAVFKGMKPKFITKAEKDAEKLFGAQLEIKLMHFVCIASLHSTKLLQAGAVANIDMDTVHVVQNMPLILQNIFDISAKISLQVHETFNDGDKFCAGQESKQQPH